MNGVALGYRVGLSIAAGGLIIFSLLRGTPDAAWALITGVVLVLLNGIFTLSWRAQRRKHGGSGGNAPNKKN